MRDLRDALIRNKTILFVLMLLLVVSTTMIFVPMTAEAGFSIWPGELYIEMPQGYPTEPIEYDIQVINKNTYDAYFTYETLDPSENVMKEDYSYIPDLSWVKVTPETRYIPSGEEGFFTVSIDIPDSEKSLHYNEKWDARVLFFEDPSYSSGSGVNILIKLVTKLLVSTPTGETIRVQPLYLFVGVIGGVLVILTVSLVRKRWNSKGQ